MLSSSPQIKRQAPELLSDAPKRPKLTPEGKAREKEIKEAEKTAKEAERIAREAEKEAKRLDREERKRIKDEAKAKEKQAKEEARMKEQAALEKKEKSQLRMGNFFRKADPRPAPTLAKEESSIFKPFYLREHTRLATLRVASNQETELFERSINGLHQGPRSIAEIFTKRHKRTKRSQKPRLPIRQRLLEVSSTPLDIRLRDTTYKLLQFHSDVRPAYFGTMTATPSSRGLLLGRNPHTKVAELDYDYDSEADWIEDDEEGVGEYLGDDDDASVVSKDSYGEEDDDFLENDEHVRSNDRSRQVGALMPIIMGIFRSDDCAAVEHMRIRRLIHTPFPIDPYHNYWDAATKTAEAKKDMDSATNTTEQPHAPVRKCLGNANATGFPETLLPELKQAIHGCNLTKIMLVEKLRSLFRAHKVSKRAIEDKLGQVAQRLGKGQHDVWTLKDT